MSIAWMLNGLLGIAVVFLCIKIYLLKKDMKEVSIELREHLSNESNTLIPSPSRDKQIKSVIVELNKALCELRKQRQEYRNGFDDVKKSVTSISHDLRTPLTAIAGYLELLDQEEKSAAVERYLEIIHNRVAMMEVLTEELFSYSTMAVYEKKPVLKRIVLNDLLEESIADFYIILKEHKIDPVIRIPYKKVYRTLDPVALSRVFSNLLNNAVKYSEGDLEITLSESGELTFVNTAYGLSEVAVAQLFNRYYTVEYAKNSTGLGLSIARHFVEQMNGTITAEYVEQRLRICMKLPDDFFESRIK